MQPAPPPGWVNKMEEFDKVEKKKQEVDDRPKWESGICSCFMDPTSCAIGTVAPCVLFGMAKQLMGEEPAANGIGFCLVGIPFAAACFFREQIRVHYNIGGHALVDGLCSIFCLQCSLCQIYRQLQAKPVMRSKLSSDFSSRLYECYQDIPTTLIVCVAPCVAFGILRRKMGQNCCLNSAFGFCALYFVAGCLNRGAIRTRYGISNFHDERCGRALPAINSLIDFFIWLLVPWCALVQELRMVRRNPYVVRVVDKRTGKVVDFPT